VHSPVPVRSRARPAALAALALLLVLAGPVAHGQLQRLFPKDVVLGATGTALQFPFVQISGKVFRLAPGGIIIDEHGRTIVHGALPERVPALYTFDLNGDVNRIYLLTAAEFEQFRAAAGRR
jgi:hypothetical protein